MSTNPNVTDSPKEENLNESESKENTIPSLIEQREMISTLYKKAPVLGEWYYVLDKRWWTSWCKYVKYDTYQIYEYPPPGPINNSSMLEVDGETVGKHLSEEIHYTFVPKQAWEKFIEWYGGGPAISRKCILPGVNKRPLIEVRPLLIKVIRSRRLNKVVQAPFSKSTSVEQFLDEMQKHMKFDRENIRVFDFHNGTKIKFLDKPNIIFGDVPIIDNQYMLIEQRTKQGLWPKDTIYARFSGQHSYQNRSPTDPGKTGLVNLGNTCFMAAAIQCLSQTVPLVDFFLTGQFRKDINRENVLGQKGELAEQYAELLDDLWSARTAVHEPRPIKKAIEKCDARFAGYQQHDSQELLVFLLDGIHEDLNRVKSKPYVEKIEGAGMDDCEIARYAWEGHKSRNDSIIVDYFQGQLKSTLTCPINKRVSTTFDPFMYLTVPIPIKNTRKIIVKVYWMESGKYPDKYGVTVEKDGNIGDLTRELSKLCGIKAENLVIVEVFQFKFHRLYYTLNDVSEIREKDKIHAHEIISTATNKSESAADLPSSVPPSRPPPPVPFPAAEIGFHARHQPPAAGTEPPAAGTEPSIEPPAAGTEPPIEPPAAGTEPSTEPPAAGTEPPVAEVSIAATELPAAGTEAPNTSQLPAAVPAADIQWDNDDIEDDDDDENEIVHLPVLHSRTDLRSLFGTPFIISVPKQITYTQLYTFIIERLSLILKKIPLAESEEDDAGSGSESDKETSNTDSNKVKKYFPIFDITACFDNGEPDPSEFRREDDTLVLREKRTLVLNWTKQYYKEFYDKHKEMEFMEDASAETKDDPNPKSASLQDCLLLFTKEEQLGAEDPWYCSDCKEFRQAFKKFDLWSAPPILIIHLKRFSYRGRSFREKLDHKIDFPLESLDLTKFVIGPIKPGEDPIYDLYAVSNHIGTMIGGHYTAYAKHRDDNKWFCYDDHVVREINPSSVISSNAYVLFYKRKDISWTAFDRALDKRAQTNEQEDQEEDSEDSDDDKPSTTIVASTATPGPHNALVVFGEGSTAEGVVSQNTQAAPSGDVTNNNEGVGANMTTATSADTGPVGVDTNVGVGAATADAGASAEAAVGAGVGAGEAGTSLCPTSEVGTDTGVSAVEGTRAVSTAGVNEGITSDLGAGKCSDLSGGVKTVTDVMSEGAT